jgi:hypothetical protein
VKPTNLKKLIFRGLIGLSAIYPVIIYANSSWHWVTRSPKKVLPIAIFFTLTLETIGIATYNKIKDKGKVLFIVTIANIVSFVLPYIERARRHIPTSGTWFWAWRSAFDSGPYYMVLFGYLFLTLLAEIPIVYYCLCKKVDNKKRLLYSIISVNVVTTLIVGCLERLLCRGQW